MDWIFTDEAHAWMDKNRQDATCRENCTVQSQGRSPGWEYGLFGFKHPEEHDYEGTHCMLHPDYPELAEVEGSKGILYCPTCEEYQK